MKTKFFDRIRRNNDSRAELKLIEREERRAQTRIEHRRAAERDRLERGYDGAIA